MQSRLRLLSAAENGQNALNDFFGSLKIGQNESIAEIKEGRKVKTSRLVSQLSDILQELDHQQADNLWSNIKNICTIALREYASCGLSNDECIEIDQDKFEKVYNVLLNISFLTLASVHTKCSYVSDSLIGTVLILHGSLLNFTPQASKIAKNICTLCVQWWGHNLINKEDVCLNALIYMLSNIVGSTLKEKAITEQSITELYKLQKALSVFDFSKQVSQSNGTSDAENLQELQQLLVTSFLHPIFLRSIAGRKFLSNVMLLDEAMMKAIHDNIVSSIKSLNNRKHGEAYGNIYYHAWTLADETGKENLEDYCIQDIMYRAIHADHGKRESQNLFTSFRSVLSAITCHNGALQVRHMLTRLFNPIIWRSLKATNAMVRYNAACLLLDTFPLMEPTDAGSQDKDELLQRQFTAIDDLIMDNCAQIRSTAIFGLCNILNLYWDVIPAQVIAVQARNLYTNMAFDASSIAVRVSVFRGTLLLLNNPCSHPLLQKLLPIIGPCLHDTSEKVRVEVANVLLAVKQTNTILFWDVCPVENILAQLEVENSTGSKRLVKLLAGSFLPLDQPIQTLVERCVNFYTRNPVAARKFYYFAKDQMTASEAGEFIYMISVFVFNRVSKSLEDDSQDENEETAERTFDAATESPLIAGLLETICIMWIAFSKMIKAASKLSKAEETTSTDLRELTKRIMINLPKMIHVCFQQFHDERNLNALLQLSSCLQPASMPIFSKKLLPKLKSLPEETPSSYYEMLIQCVVQWGWSNQILQLICDWLKTDKKNDQKPNNEGNQNQKKQTSTKLAKRGANRKGRASKSVKFVVNDEEKRPEQALKYLQCIVGDEDSLNVVLNNDSCWDLFTEISYHLHYFVTEMVSQIQGNPPSGSWSNKMMSDSLSAYFTLLASLYLSSKNSNSVKESANKSDSDKQSSSHHQEQQRLCSLISLLQVDVIGQLKLSSQLIENQNQSFLSLTLSSQSKPPARDYSSILKQMSYARECLDKTFPAIVELLKRGVPVAERALDFLSAFVETGTKTIDYAGSICALYKELFDWHLSYIWSGNTEETATQLTSQETFIQVFDDVLMSLMMYSRRNPDGFAELFRKEIHSCFRHLFKSAFQFSTSLTNYLYETMTRKTISAVLADIAHQVMSTSESRSRAKLSDLPQFCACVTPVVTATAVECDYICRVTLPGVFAEHSTSSHEPKQRILANKSCFLLLNVLAKDGKNPSAAAASLEQLKQNHEDSIENLDFSVV